MKNTIFYFTGTGNSLQMSKDIAANLQECEIISISKSIETVKHIEPKETVGFVFPVYYCGLPQIVREFLLRIDLKNAAYIYIVAAYGSTGGNGGCLSQANKILMRKGSKPNASFYVKTVDNFILWSWDIPSEGKHAGLHDKAKERAIEIARVVQNRRNYADKSIMEHLGPVVFRYKRFVEGVNADDQAFHITSDCVSCGLCAKVCPTKNIELNDNKPSWQSKKCQRCLACLHLCPQRAIEYGDATKKKSRYKNPYISLNELMGED